MLALTNALSTDFNVTPMSNAAAKKESPSTIPRSALSASNGPNNQVPVGYLLKEIHAYMKKPSIRTDLNALAEMMISNFSDYLAEVSALSLIPLMDAKKKLKDPIENSIQESLDSYFKAASKKFTLSVVEYLTSAPLSLDMKTADVIADSFDTTMDKFHKRFFKGLFTKLTALKVPQVESLEDSGKLFELLEKLISEELHEYFNQLNSTQNLIYRRLKKSIEKWTFLKDIFSTLDESKLVAMIDKFVLPLFNRDKIKSIAINITQLIFYNSKLEAFDLGYEDLLDPLDNLDKKSAGEVVGTILRRFAEHYSTPEYIFAVTLLKLKYPRIGIYIEDWKQVFNVPKYILSKTGISLILEMLRAKGKLGDTPCIVCDDHDLAGDALVRFFKTENGSKSVGLICQYGAHYVPVFADKKDGTLRIYAPQDLTWCAKESLGSAGIPCVIYAQENDLFRQKDNISCSVFAIRDISKMCQDPELMDFFEEHISKKSLEAPILVYSTITYQFEVFPPALMDSFQSLKRLSMYDSLAGLRSQGRIRWIPAKNLPLEVREANVTISGKRIRLEQTLIVGVVSGIL